MPTSQMSTLIPERLSYSHGHTPNPEKLMPEAVLAATSFQSLSAQGLVSILKAAGRY
jgi:hypothetical protein